MRFANTLIGLSFVAMFSIGASSCGSIANKTDAFECTLILKDPIESTYAFCINRLTKEEKRIALHDLRKCIRDENRTCNWILTDVDEREKIIKAYKDACQNPRPLVIQQPVEK